MDQNKNKDQSQFQIYKKELLNCITAYSIERNNVEALNILARLSVDHGIQKGLQTDFKSGIRGNSEDLQNRENTFGVNIEKAKSRAKSIWAVLLGVFEDFTLRILIISSCLAISTQFVPEYQQSTLHLTGYAILILVAIYACITAYAQHTNEKLFYQMNYEQIINQKQCQFQVIRNGELQVLSSSELMVGDVTRIEQGMFVPADGLLIECNDMLSNENAVTGETALQKKCPLSICQNYKQNQQYDATPLLLSGSQIVTGQGLFVVINVGVGMQSCLQKNEFNDQPTALQERIMIFAEDIGLINLYASILLFAILLLRFIFEQSYNGWFLGLNLINACEILRFFMVGFSFIWISFPEGLPLCYQLIQAQTLQKMLKDNNLVRKEQALETMGEVNVICCDQTGILTQGRLSLAAIWNQELVNIDQYCYPTDISKHVPLPYQELFILNIAANSTATINQNGSQIDIACLDYLTRCGIDCQMLVANHPCVAQFGSSSRRKRQSSILQVEDNMGRLYIKGASEIILHCSTHICLFSDTIQAKPKLIDKCMFETIMHAIEKMGAHGMRTMVLAYKDIDLAKDDLVTQDEQGVMKIEDNNLIIYAVLGFKDMLRKEVPDDIQDCLKAGITIMTVTSDMKVLAQEVAIQSGIIKQGELYNIMEGSEFFESVGGIICTNCKLDDEQCKCNSNNLFKNQLRIIKNEATFKTLLSDNHLKALARARPQDKYALVTGLKQLDYVVAVTADGTNDVPALQQGDVGICTFQSTEAAQEASQIILLDGNFHSIVSAVVNGRNFYDSIRKFIQFQLILNINAIITMLLGAAIANQQPLTVIQLLWANLIAYILFALTLATEMPPNREQLLARMPHTRDERILSTLMHTNIIGMALFQIIVLILLILHGNRFLSYFGMKCGDHYMAAFIFNVFIWVEIFNTINSRKVSQKITVFSDIRRNKQIVLVVLGIAVIQILLTKFGGNLLEYYKHEGGLTIWQSFLCALIGLSSIIWSLIWKILFQTVYHIYMLFQKSVQNKTK